jgi:hypothetical protein
VEEGFRERVKACGWEDLRMWRGMYMLLRR